MRGHPGNGAAAFIGRDGEQIRYRTLAAEGPKVDEGFAFELAAEQGANPGAGEPERMAVGGVQFENEGIAQGLTNGARLDVGTLRRRALAAPFFPVSVKLPACRVFHDARSCIRNRDRPAVPDRDRFCFVRSLGAVLSRRRAAAACGRAAAALTQN